MMVADASAAAAVANGWELLKVLRLLRLLGRTAASDCCNLWLLLLQLLPTAVSGCLMLDDLRRGFWGAAPREIQGHPRSPSRECLENDPEGSPPRFCAEAADTDRCEFRLLQSAAVAAAAAAAAAADRCFWLLDADHVDNVQNGVDAVDKIDDDVK